MHTPPPSSHAVIVVGAGAAGIFAAIAAAERGQKVLLIEKNTKPGVKILMSGGTRCNVTQATDRRGIVEAFGDQGSFLHSALASLGPEDVVDLIEFEGVPTKVEPTGKVFPVSDRAIDVRDALWRRLKRSGARTVFHEPVVDIQQNASGGFEIQTPTSRYHCEKLIVTSGGQSYPGCGTTGDGYAWAKSLGHSIVPPRPALVPITTTANWIHSLRGVTIDDVQLQVAPQRPSDAANAVASRRGSMLLTHFGLSGPVVLDISRVVTEARDRKNLVLICDFLPNVSRQQLARQLQTLRHRDGKRLVHQALPAALPKRLIEHLVDFAQIPKHRKAAELSRDEQQRLVESAKHTTIPIAGTLGFKKAEVTAGGVARDEVDSRCMQSKLVPNLFFAGEILDLDGPIGGYNFQAAFSTGWLAGNSV